MNPRIKSNKLFFLASALIILLHLFSLGEASCKIGSQVDAKGKAKASDPSNYNLKCISALRNQIQMEFEASFQYLIMGAYFDRDSINLKGFAQMFMKHADEEREHGIAFLNYLRHRGDTESSVLSSGNILPLLGKVEWMDAEEALRDALSMEKSVSASIKRLIDTCDNSVSQDYLTADWLTGHWLEEQMEGQRYLAGLINSLNNFRRDHEPLGDWLFSNSLL